LKIPEFHWGLGFGLNLNFWPWVQAFVSLSSVCTVCIVAKRYVFNTEKLSKQVSWLFNDHRSDRMCAYVHLCYHHSFTNGYLLNCQSHYL